jgi:hypothetical protein
VPAEQRFSRYLLCFSRWQTRSDHAPFSEFNSNFTAMAGYRTTRDFMSAIEERLEALEMSSIETAKAEKRYAIPDIEAQKKEQRDNSDVIRDAIIGFADGLTVPFALTAGLSS